MAYQEFLGRWAFAESDNYDKYLEEIAIGWTHRAEAKMTRPILTFEVTNEGKHWKITFETMFKSLVNEFDLGTEFVEETVDGRKMMSKFTFVDGTLFQTQSKIEPRDKDSEFELCIESGGEKDMLVITCRSGDVTAFRVYNAIREGTLEKGQPIKKPKTVVSEHSVEPAVTQSKTGLKDNSSALVWNTNMEYEYDTGLKAQMASKDVENEEQEMLDESFASLSISELGSDFCCSRNSFTSENLAELSAQLEEEDKETGKNQARLIALQMDRNMDSFNLQIQVLENSNEELRVSLERERDSNAEFRHEIGKKEGILEEQEKKLSEYERRFSEMNNELNLLRKEKSVSDSIALQSAISRNEFLKKYEELSEEKNGLYATVTKLSGELEKARTDLENLDVASKLTSAEYEQKLKGLTTENERLKLELDSKTKELSETNGRIEKRDEKIKLIDEKYKRQKELLKKFNEQNHLIKEKYSGLKGKYRELEELRKREKKLHAYSVELMTKKALESARSPSVSACHSTRASSVFSVGRSSTLGASSSVSRHSHMPKKQPEVIFLDDSGETDGSVGTTTKLKIGSSKQH